MFIMSPRATLGLVDEDKLRLIKLVHKNSVLWDSRLATFKGADSKKLTGWTNIGKELKIHSKKAERCFKRLREVYRKELAKHKRFGDGFKSNWQFYDEISFLRPIIKERKSGLYKDVEIPVSGYACYNYGVDKREDGNRSSPTCSRGMVEIPFETEAMVDDANERKPLKHRFTSAEKSSGGCRESRLDLHEMFGNLVTSKLNTLSNIEADKQMKMISQLIFD